MEILVEESEEVYEILDILWEGTAECRGCVRKLEKMERENDRGFNELEGLKR